MKLTQMTAADELAASLLSAHDGLYRSLPDYEDRAAWEAVPDKLKKAWVREAEQYLGFHWPSLTAADYSVFFTDGTRERYDNQGAARETALAVLLLAECLEGKGRFLTEIVNLIWLLCEQTAWNSPAHHYLSKQPEGPLPDPQEPLFDLLAGEIAAALAWTSRFLEKPLDQISPLIRTRIHQKLERRIITPYLNRDDFWWLGFGEREPNNWNPWCNSNLLACVLLGVCGGERKERLLRRYLASLERFLDVQYEDGGCDEGATYWTHSAGRLFANLEMMHRHSGGAVNMYHQPLIRKLGQFIHRMHIAGDYYVNFADGPAISHPDYAMIARYGRRIGDPQMAAFGASRISAAAIQGRSRYSLCLFHELCRLFDHTEGASAGEEGGPEARHEAAAPAGVWLPHVQVLAARGGTGERSLFLAAKGGHNDESHNHNDVGQWILYRNGLPVLVDIGVGTYTRQTFGPDRYEIWTMQSQYHNLPVINGYGQKEGRSFAARHVSCRLEEETVSFELDLAGAYPPGAGVGRWLRQLRLDRSDISGPFVTVAETWQLHRPCTEVALHYISAMQPSLAAPGQLWLGTPGGGAVLNYDPQQLECHWEVLPLTDPKLREVWGERLYRIRLLARDTGAEGQASLHFTLL